MNMTLFRSALLDWFDKHQRPLPWRKERHPYHVWISEIMGQQTQMDRVVAYFRNWMEKFPDIPALAAASEQDVLKAWEGLGYYSRARNIRRTARLLVSEHGSALPDQPEALLALPGIGTYTAAAILSIAFDRPTPLLDANVERVLCRIDDVELPPRQAAVRKQLLRRCTELLSEDQPAAFNQAMMELGALICTPRKPSCEHCPVRQCCRALAAGTVELRPVSVKKQEKVDIAMACGIIEHDGRFYIQQRLETDVWGGLWEFPGGRIEEGETPEEAAVREVAEETEFRVTSLRAFATVRHHYTQHRVTLHAFFCCLQAEQTTTPRLHAASQFRWVTWDEMDSFAFPAGHRQLVGKMACQHGMASAEMLVPIQQLAD